MARAQRRRLAKKLAAHQLEDRVIEIEVEEELPSMMEIFSGTGLEEVGVNLSEVFERWPRTRKRQRKVSISDARSILTQEETERLVDMDQVYNQSITAVEESGIVFIDEIDKIAGPRPDGQGPDVSGEGVQRDILPIVEGSTVMTRYGAVQTEYILFIAAGAFNVAKPSDLIPELQGRFPIRVELKPLSEADLERILQEPDNSLIKQYTALLATEEVTLQWTEDGIHEVAVQAMLVNEQDENIGARRLHTICETVLEDISYRGPELKGQTIVIDRGFVQERLTDLVRNPDLRKYIL
jgi:ATP-dependent HslUV protease ATP-binding subunit HslU